MFPFTGYIAAIVAALFFGSNYVPMKKFPVGDGFFFQWVMSCGILMIGIASLAINREGTFVVSGILGGALWSLGNALVIPILQLIGLGMGLLVWSGTSLILGYIVGRLGLFGLEAEAVKYWYLSYIGLGFAVLALLIFFFVKPTLKDDAASPSTSRKSSSVVEGSDGEEDTDTDKIFVDVEAEPEEVFVLYRAADIQHPVWRPLFKHIPDHWQIQFQRKIKYAKPFGKVFGVLMSILSGCAFSVTLVPYKLWNQDLEARNITPGLVDFLFCYTTGIFTMSSAILLLYLLLAYPPAIYPKATLPSLLCGMAWAIASAGWMVSTGTLGFTVGFPLVVIGPIIVTMFWSIFVFREIRGMRNYILVAASMVCIIAAVACIAFSN